MTGYASPHGVIPGLRARLATWAHRLGTDKTLPWPGLGLIEDLEAAVRLLDLREFAEWLRTKGDPDQQRFGDEILARDETLEAFGNALGHGRGGPSGKDPVQEVEQLVRTEAQHSALCDALTKATGDEFENLLDAVAALASESAQGDAMRSVLVDVGALDPADVTTDPAALLRALLS